jgi:hypothetical protein
VRNTTCSAVVEVTDGDVRLAVVAAFEFATMVTATPAVATVAAAIQRSFIDARLDSKMHTRGPG